MSETFELDGEQYSLGDVSDRAKKIVKELNALEGNLREKIDLMAIFTKAKNAYMAELKSEILSRKSGFDFTS